jgi:hypothetical protein
MNQNNSPHEIEVTVPIDEHDFDEYPDLGPDWLDCPILPPDEMFAVIGRCGELDRRSVNLFAALERRPRSGLAELFLWRNLYQPNSHYIYVTPDPVRYGYTYWRPIATKIAIQANMVAPCALFSNTLSCGDTPPSERAFNAGFTVYTFEFDHTPLDDQLSVIWSGKLKGMEAELCRFRDYRGYEAVYSGRKSVHFHFVFDIRHLKRDLIVTGNSSYQDNWTCDLPDTLLRSAYSVCWTRLAEIFGSIAEIDEAPDPRLKSWEQLRRCPWALRQVKDAHPLGLPTNHRVPQVVLASNVFKNTKRGATEWFHEPYKLVGESASDPVRRRRNTFFEVDFATKTRELELFEHHAPDIFRQIIGAEYPKWTSFEVNEQGMRCHFLNGPGDRNPSSFCEGNRDRIVLQGRHQFGSEGVPLEATPNQVFDWIVARYGNPQEKSDDWIMRRYKAAVHDRDSLARFLNDYVTDVVAPLSTNAHLAWVQRLVGRPDKPNTHVLIRGPQGCGKSTKVMANIPAIHERDPGMIFFSSPSIEQAREKIETFVRLNRNEQFVPYLYLSLTALYERFCPEEERFNHIDILEEGGSSWLHAVFWQQPEVYEAMFAYRTRLIDLQAEGKTPVLFGTHETMRQHARGGTSRLFYAGGFDARWFESMGLNERESWRSRLLRENRIHRVIVDEVTAHDLVSINPSEVVEWVNECAKQIGFADTRDIAERYSRFTTYLSEHPCRDMTWNLLLEILTCAYEEEHLVQVSGREVPFDEADGIYAEMVGKPYYVRPRCWWNGFWRVTMLTTEAVPTRIIEAIDAEAASRDEEQDDRFQVYDFGLPESERDIVTVELQRACKKGSLPELVRGYKEQYPKAEIISDMVRDRIAEFTVTTHMAAKGSNSFIGSDIVAFYNALSPPLFGELGALNARFERADLVRLFYVDRFEQTAGRNRGYRGRPGCDHRAVFPPRLNAWLSPAMSGASYVRVNERPRVSVKAGP